MPSKINLAYEGDTKPAIEGLSLDTYRFVQTSICGSTTEAGDFYRLDWHHWLFSNNDFRGHIKNVIAAKPKYLLVFDSPFGYERPPQIPISAFEAKAYERTHVAIDEFREKSPNTILLSPAVDILEEDLGKRYLDYFIHHRNLFDGYAVRCCFSPTEQNCAKLNAFLNAVLKINSKPVWVTTWAIPSCDQIISNSTNTEENPKILTSEKAASRMVSLFKEVEKITHGNSLWFYSTAQDLYGKITLEKQWWSDYFYRPNNFSEGWDWYHFLGLYDFRGKIKTPIAEALKRLCHAETAS